MLDRRLVVLLESSEHERLRALASRCGESAGSLVRAAVRRILEEDARGVPVCRDSSATYGSEFGDELLQRLRDFASRQGSDVGEFLAGLLDEHAQQLEREEALVRLGEHARNGLYEAGEVGWTREDLHER